jgi:YVTN family beta-propeller protein
MRRLFAALMLVGILIGGCGSGVGAAQPPGFTTIRDVPLTGGTGRFDYQSLDEQAHRLSIAHLGAGIVTVFDTETGSVAGDVANVPGAHGVLAIPALGRVYATATDANRVVMIDPSALTVVATIPGGRLSRWPGLRTGGRQALCLRRAWQDRHRD